MLTKKQIRLLEILDEQLLACKDCELWTGGSCKPYWTTESRFGLIGEAPGRNEVDSEPFIGRAGKLLWKWMKAVGFEKRDFVIVNTVNCRPVTPSGNNGKPSKEQCDTCFPYLRKYLKIVRPKKTILLGNYAVGAITGEYVGIVKKNSMVLPKGPFGTNVVLSVHPSAALYNSSSVQLLRDSIKVLNEL